MVKMTHVRRANKTWFGKGNKRFFGDVWYRVRKGKTTGSLYLVRCTSAFTDMFGGKKRYHYRINKVNSVSLKIEGLIDDSFDTLADVNLWLSIN